LFKQVGLPEVADLDYAAPRPRVEPNRRVKYCERRAIARRLLLTQPPSDINLNHI